MINLNLVQTKLHEVRAADYSVKEMPENGKHDNKQAIYDLQDKFKQTIIKVDDTIETNFCEYLDDGTMKKIVDARLNDEKLSLLDFKNVKPEKEDGPLEYERRDPWVKDNPAAQTPVARKASNRLGLPLHAVSESPDRSPDRCS